jgi:hypothetical protein
VAEVADVVVVVEEDMEHGDFEEHDFEGRMRYAVNH